MRYRLSLKASSNPSFVYYCITNGKVPPMAQKYANLEAGHGNKARQWQVNGIQVGHLVTQYGSHQTVKASNNTEFVRLHFGLKGDYQFNYLQLARQFDLAGGHHNIMYSNGIDLEVYNKPLVIETFGVDFPKETFIAFANNSHDLVNRFIESVLAGQPAILSPVWGTVDAKIQSVVDEVLLSPYQAKLQEVFLLAKSLELLVLCIDNYSTLLARQHKHIKTTADKEKLIAARDYINARVATPPNLTEVARAVGMNEFKLKHGFKELFQSTVFGYLTERRLNLARQYLLDTQKTAAQIATDLGYSSPQHFNQQFRNRFGVTPNSIRNTP